MVEEALTGTFLEAKVARREMMTMATPTPCMREWYNKPLDDLGIVLPL